MSVKIIYGDLFTFGNQYPIAHCISADYALGAGIAKEVEQIYRVRKELKKSGTGIYPDCIRVGNVFNLVSKEKYWHKPTYKTLEATLLRLRRQAEKSEIAVIAMPKIGCGLDGLNWNHVKDIIEDSFKDSNVCIICVN